MLFVVFTFIVQMVSWPTNVPTETCIRTYLNMYIESVLICLNFPFTGVDGDFSKTFFPRRTTRIRRGKHVLKGRPAVGQSWGVDQTLPKDLVCRCRGEKSVNFWGAKSASHKPWKHVSHISNIYEAAGSTRLWTVSPTDRFTVRLKNLQSKKWRPQILKTCEPHTLSIHEVKRPKCYEPSTPPIYVP